MPIDAVTKRWIRNASDELAVKAGCHFDEERGAYTVWWIEKHCKLYEGDYAGQPMRLWGCHQCEIYGLPASNQFDTWEKAKPYALQRAAAYAKCVKAGHWIDWQYECIMRLFGWCILSKKWNREVRRFKQGTLFLAKKNKKSPTASAIGIYLTCGDGEHGAHTYFGHKDGDAAKKIMGEHAKQMILQSKELYPYHPDGKPKETVCKLNGTTGRITYQPTNSYMEAMSSSNSRTQKSKEGLNGNVIFDELHVVDNELVRRTSRMGISRSEPMHLEISTAGDNPDSYGRKRFDYARNVESGKQIDQALFVAIYAAPQDVTDEQIKEDPLKYGRMANPAMGQTVDPEEFLEDFQKSQQSMQDWLDFKMYRLDIWQKGSNPWLPAGSWDLCKVDFTEDDLVKETCWASLDLSRTKDMTALVLVFPFTDENQEPYYRILAYFWLPEERAESLKSLGRVLEWVEEGWLVLTPDAVTDYSFVRDKFYECHEKFNIVELLYDPHFAEELTQQLEQGIFDSKGNIIVEGTGVPRFSFDQTDNNFAAPTEELERLILSRGIQHNGNPVLSWQMDHAQIIKKINKVKRIVKPSKDSRRTVDGPVCIAMGLAHASQGTTNTVSVEVWD